jgi:signal transduction histidine kinase
VIENTLEKIKKHTSIHLFNVYVDEGIEKVPADETRLERVMYNLLENAVKYSPQGGQIQIVVSKDSDHFVISVSDEGIGLSGHDQARLFSPFQRVDEKLDDIKGIGLGLLVCRRLVEAHGGKIWIESRPGYGSTFYFTLPLKAKINKM